MRRGDTTLWPQEDTMARTTRKGTGTKATAGSKRGVKDLPATDSATFARNARA